MLAPPLPVLAPPLPDEDEEPPVWAPPEEPEDEPLPEPDEDEPPDPVVSVVAPLEPVDVVSVEVVAVVLVVVSVELPAADADPLGTVWSGTERGTTSATWLPPHALSANPLNSTATPNPAVLTRISISSRAGPCGARRSDSR